MDFEFRLGRLPEFYVKDVNSMRKLFMLSFELNLTITLYQVTYTRCYLIYIIIFLYNTHTKINK